MPVTRTPMSLTSARIAWRIATFVTSDPENERRQLDILWPLISKKQKGANRHVRILPFYWHDKKPEMRLTVGSLGCGMTWATATAVSATQVSASTVARIRAAARRGLMQIMRERSCLDEDYRSFQSGHGCVVVPVVHVADRIRHRR